MGRFDSVYEKNEIRQVLYIKNTKFTVETIPYFLELFIQVSEHLLTQIKGMAPTSNQAIAECDSRKFLSENSKHFTNDMTLADDIYKTQLYHEPSSKHKLVKPKATYHDLPVKMGESIFENFSSHKSPYEMAGTCKLMSKHGTTAVIASVEGDWWLVDDKDSIETLNTISRLPDIANSILKIKLNVNRSSDYTQAIDLTARLRYMFTNLETTIFGGNLSYDFLWNISLDILATVQNVKFLTLTYIDCSYDLIRGVIRV